MDYAGLFDTGATVRLLFTTHAQTGAAVAPSSAFEAADVKIYKDGSATERSSANGVTMTSPFDSIVGLHQVAIDLSDNTDSGFYAAGSRYIVVLSPDETVDSLAVVRVIGSFSIGPVSANVTQWLGTACSTPTTNGVPEVDVIHMGGSAQSLADLKDFADDGYDPSTNKVQGVVLTDTVTTYTGDTPQTGDAFARLGAPAGASVSADIAAIEAQTDDIGVAGAGLTAVPWNAAWDAEVQSEATDALDAYDPPTKTELDTALGDLPTAAEIFTAVLTTALTEAYAADGAAPTLAQAIFLIQQALTEFAISGTTMTVKKLDGTTTALTLTLSDATNPTGVTRAT